MASPEEERAIELEARRHGDRVQRPPTSVYHAEAAKYREPPWWHTTDGTVKVIGAIALAGSTLGVGGWVASRAEKPEPPPAALVACPPPKNEAERMKQPDVCVRLEQLEALANRAALDAAEALARSRKDSDPQPAATIQGIAPTRP
jgi:hypothetical protein